MLSCFFYPTFNELCFQKVLKQKWKPASAERLKAHDLKVSENWKAFNKGQLEVHDFKLKEHLAKFTDRKDGVKIISDEGELNRVCKLNSVQNYLVKIYIFSVVIVEYQ